MVQGEREEYQVRRDKGWGDVGRGPCAQYISLKGLLASYGRGKNRQFEPANRLYLTREFP